MSPQRDFEQTRRKECTGKQRYRSESEARGVAQHQMQQGSPPLRAYECIWCRGWHLTKAL